MPISLFKFPRKKNKQTESVIPDAQSSSIVGGNGWLACKEAFKTLKDMAPGPLVPLKIAVVGVLACMDHAEVRKLLVPSADLSLIRN
jgi:hypothetical protein